MSIHPRWDNRVTESLLIWSGVNFLTRNHTEVFILAPLCMLYSQCNYRLVLFIIPSPISGFPLYIPFPLVLLLQPSFFISLDRINSCPNNCSGHGKCTSGNSIASRVYCECDKYWKGEACDIPYCRNNCGSPDHGYCDLTGEKLCVCNDSWQGTTHFHSHFHSSTVFYRML